MFFNQPCFYCGIIDAEKFNGIDRVDSSVGYIFANCVSCCWNCNDLKSNNSLEMLEEVYSRLDKIISRLKLI